jgi:signal transduction histidine kinase
MISEHEENAAGCQDPQLLADLFHALSQPLTTLRCYLDLSLRRSPTSKQNRQELESALQAAESVTRLVADIRELVEGTRSPAGQRSRRLG